MADEYGGVVSGCLWDPEFTECQTSGAGVGIDLLGAVGPGAYALNGWSGDPNWVIINPSDTYTYDNYPRLAWEGTDGEVITEPPTYWAPSDGSGTESDPYLIRDASALTFLNRASIYWDKHFVLVEDVDFHFNRNFSPIGVCRDSSFSGTFDGNGHVIRNVVFDGVYEFDADEATAWNLGLFGYVTGEVRNLNLENVRFEAGMNSRQVGLLAGTNEGVIRNCSATGSISVGTNSQFIGELVGLNMSDEISDCEATATIKAGEGSTDIGGLVGW